LSGKGGGETALVIFLGKAHQVLTNHSSYLTAHDFIPLPLSQRINPQATRISETCNWPLFTELFDTYTRIYIPLEHDQLQEHDMPNARCHIQRADRIKKKNKKYSMQQAMQDHQEMGEKCKKIDLK